MPRAAIRRFRRGSTATGVVVLLGAFGALGATALMMGPGDLLASEITAEPRAARSPAHQQTIELVAGMLARSRAVLARHEAATGPFEEVVLWVEDRENPGEIDAHELAVITHSRVLQTLTYYGRPRAGDGPRWSPEQSYSRAFCQVWRTHPDVTAHLIGAGLSDVRFEGGARIQAQRPLMRISFTWASDSADAPDEASILVDVVTIQRPDRAGE